MNVTIADDSPLGRYLAELDAEDGGFTTSLARELSAAAVPQPMPAPDSRKQRASLTERLLVQLHTLNNGIQLTVLRQMMYRLMKVKHLGPELIEDVLDTAALSEERLYARSSWVLYLADSIDLSATSTSIAWGGPPVVVAALLSLYAASPVITKIFLTACATVAASLLLAELACRLWLLCFRFVSQRLEKAIRSHVHTKEELEMTFRQAIDLIKRAELAARGYRLGHVLPPLGRLEESSHARKSAKLHLQCQRLRWELRSVNDAMEKLSSQVARRCVSSDTCTERRAGDVKEDAATPSLLVTALMKRHSLTSILLDCSLRDILVDDLASLLRSGVSLSENRDGMSMIQTLTRQEIIYEHTTREMLTQVKGLTTIISRMVARTDETPKPVADGGEALPANAPNDVVSVTRALRELQTSCETLQALTIGAQEDASQGIGVSLDQEKRAEWATRLRGTREKMSKLIQQLSKEWEALERVFEEVELSGTDSGDREAAAKDADEAVNETELTLLAKDRIPAEKRNTERDFLLVFTATSTGEKDFDLQALLRQQQLDKEAAAAPVPSFMNELNSVLEERQALESTPVLVKQIDDDTQESTSDTSTPKELNGGARSSATPSQVDIQQLLQSRFKAQLCEESFGGSDSEDEDTNPVASVNATN